MSKDKLEAGQIRIDEEGDKFEVLIIGDHRSFFKYLHNGVEDATLNDDLLEYTSLVKPERKEIEVSYIMSGAGTIIMTQVGSDDEEIYHDEYSTKLELIDGKFYEVQ